MQIAADDAERALLLWKGHKSAVGTIARIAPDYYLRDAVVPHHAPRRGTEEGVRHRREQRLTMMNHVPRGGGSLHPTHRL